MSKFPPGVITRVTFDPHDSLALFSHRRGSRVSSVYSWVPSSHPSCRGLDDESWGPDVHVSCDTGGVDSLLFEFSLVVLIFYTP